MAKWPPSQESKNIGSRMQMVLTGLGINQTDAAFRLGLNSQGVLSHYLTGKREIPINIIKRFHTEFNVPLNVLLLGEDASLNTAQGEGELLAAEIIKAILEWLRVNKLQMTPDAKAKAFMQLFQKKCTELKFIHGFLSAMHGENPNMFKKSPGAVKKGA